MIWRKIFIPIILFFLKKITGEAHISEYMKNTYFLYGKIEMITKKQDVC